MAIVSIEDPAVVHEHALGKVGVRLALGFHVDQQPLVPAVSEADFDEPVSLALGHLRIGHDLTQHGVQEPRGHAEVDCGVHLGEVELEEVLNDVLPAAVGV